MRTYQSVTPFSTLNFGGRRMLLRANTIFKAIISRVILRNLLLLVAIAALFFMSIMTGNAGLTALSCTPSGCSDFEVDSYAQVNMYGICAEDDPQADGYAFVSVFESCDDPINPTYDEAWGESGQDSFLAECDATYLHHTVSWGYAWFNCDYGTNGDYSDEYGCDYWWQ